MSMTWFAVLNQAQMRVFTRDSRTKPLLLIGAMENALVNVKGKELARHKPGSRPKGGKGTRISIMDSGRNPHELIVADFAHRIARFLNEARKKNRFRELQIAAEPGFLGLVRGELDSETKKRVYVWVGKDLQKSNANRIAEAFDAV